MSTAQKKPRAGYVNDIVTGICRCAYPHIAAPNDQGQYANNKYQLNVLVPKTDPDTYDRLMAGALEAGKQVLGPSLTNLEVALSDGDDKNRDFMRDHWVFTPKTNKQPPVFDGKRQPLSQEDIEQLVHHGCFVRVKVTAGFYKKNLDKKMFDLLKQAGANVMAERQDTGAVSYFQPAATFYLEALQYLKPNDGTISAGRRSGPAGFDEYDGEEPPF